MLCLSWFTTLFLIYWSCQYLVDYLTLFNLSFLNCFHRNADVVPFPDASIPVEQQQLLSEAMESQPSSTIQAPGGPSTQPTETDGEDASSESEGQDSNGQDVLLTDAVSSGPVESSGAVGSESVNPIASIMYETAETAASASLRSADLAVSDVPESTSDNWRF